MNKCKFFLGIFLLFSILLISQNNPDLMVGEHRIQPKPIYMGDAVHLEVTAMNQGDAPSAPCQATLSVTGPQGFQALHFILDVPGRNPGQGAALRRNFQLPRQGIYKFTLRLDSNNRNEESDENNNQKVIVVLVNPLPDLIVCIQIGETDVIGSKNRLWASVKNIGAGPSPPCRLRWYVKANGVVWRDVPALQPGKHKVFYRHATWHTMGRKKMEAIVDHENTAVREINEKNNKVGGYFHIYTVNTLELGNPKKKCSNHD